MVAVMAESMASRARSDDHAQLAVLRRPRPEARIRAGHTERPVHNVQVPSTITGLDDAPAPQSRQHAGQSGSSNVLASFSVRRPLLGERLRALQPVLALVHLPVPR